jgi:small-conductance mechanosensitive channel/CRP-like cAMP-binding protein
MGASRFRQTQENLMGALYISEFVGIAVAVVFVIVVRMTLPVHAKGLVRQPLVLLVVHLVANAAQRFTPAESGAGRALALASLFFLLASIGTSAVVLLFDGILGRRRATLRIVRDIAVGFVYVAVLLASLRASGVEPGSILTTSALLTAAIALSLQETLGNMIAGLAIQVQRPFELDDWIQFDPDPKHIGRVVEINWRATKVVTLDDVEVIVPNATLAKAPITNFTKPLPASRRSLFFQTPSDAPPHLVQRTVLDALKGSFGVLARPEPSVVTNGFVDGNVEYWVRFWTEDFDKRDGVDGAARDRIWYALSRIGEPLAQPNRWVRMNEATQVARVREEHHTERRKGLLEQVELLKVLSDAQRSLLASRSVRRIYGGGERIVGQGDTSAEMFLIESGVVTILKEQDGREIQVARLGPGEVFGEMALVTGEPRNATVRAASACELVVIDHAALREVLETAPELAGRISRVMAERNVRAAEGDAPATVKDRAEESSQLLARIRSFFKLR